VTEPATQPGDRLLWLAAVAVVGMGLAWVIVEQPWSGDDGTEAIADSAPVQSGAPAAAGTLALAEPATAAASEQGAAPDPLYLARLALDAGMLVEPAEYSAWTLFGNAMDANPDDPAARAGLEEVAAALMPRGRTALEQGRLDDAESVAGTIAARFPEHEAALALAADIAVARRPPPPPAARQPAASTQAAARARPDPAARIPELHASFLTAMGQNSILTPSGTSARDVVGEMIGIAPQHELTTAARQLLVTELLDRSKQALEALDTAGAQSWIDAAGSLASDPAEVVDAQERLTRHLVDAESKKRLPVSALDQTVRVAAEYPKTAIDRDIEGWVDIEFVVTPEGGTADITVVDASHARYFRNEAVAAVEQWHFEPVIFMGQPIPQHAYTRLEFVLN
jgi:TonB family protein